MAQKTDRFQNIALTQGSADAFVQGSLVTGIDSDEGVAWLLKRVDMNFPAAAGLQAMSADAEIHWSLTRDSKTAIAGLDDRDCILADGFFLSLTTSGQVAVPAQWIWHPPEGTIVVEPTIYAQLDSTASGLALQATMRLHYEPVKVSELEILRALNQGF